MSDSLATYSMHPPVVPATHLPSSASARSCARTAAVPRPPDLTIQTHTNTDTDPLLTNLSPEATLKALTETPEVDSDEQLHLDDPLSRSIAELSTRERSLGIRAALVAQKLREWHAEVSSWKWPGPREAALGRGFENPYAYFEKESDQEKAALFLGCKLETVVNEEERRVAEIKDGLEDLGVEDLERHVLGVHLAAIQSGADNGTSDSPTYNRLNDFTAVITATILNGLPILSKLNNLLNTWDIRFEVLRQIPPLLESLKNATFEMDRALARLEQGLLPEFDDPRFTRRLYEIARARLEDILLVVGHHFDVVLDALEGSQDCLPSYWIDDMDALESDFASWSVAAQKKATENEWHRDHPLDRFPSPIPEETDEVSKNEGEIIPQAHAEPPEARHYWTSSEDESLDNTSSLATSPFSFRDSMPSIVVQNSHGEDGVVVAGRNGDKKGKPNKEMAKTDDSATKGLRSQSPPRQAKNASTSSLQFKDPFRDSKFSADDIEILPEAEEDMSPTRNRQKRRMTLPLSRYIEESDNYEGPLSLPNGGSSPTPAAKGTKKSGAIHRRDNESKSLDPKKGNISLRDAFNAADALNQVIKSPRTTQSVRSPSGRGIELQDPFVEIQPTPLQRQRSVSPSPPNPSLTIVKKRSKIPTPSSSPRENQSDTSSRASPSTASSPSRIPVRQRNDQSPSPPSNVRRRRRPTLEEKINTILDGIPVKLDLDAHTQVNGRLAPSESKTRSSSPPSGSPQNGPTNTLFRLIPAHPRRSKDESSVRLFHLYRGERLAPLKLFVRTIGENSERVMVRVGGGWADFGEFLREYVAHHGQRAVSEKWEVQSVSSRSSPRQSPRKRNASNPPKSGRTTPVSRPSSRSEPFPDFPASPPAPSAAPPPVPAIPASLSQNPRGSVTQKSHDRPSLTAANVAKASGSPAPTTPIFPSLARKMSVSSMASGTMSVFSAFAENIHGPHSAFFANAHPVSRPGTSLGFRPGSPFSAAPIVPHAPLGLAGPRPRRMSITPESEAWVEDMMGKARQSSGGRSNILSSIQFPHEEAERQQQQQQQQQYASQSLHMMRSFNDIDRFNKRVFLRRFNQ